MATNATNPATWSKWRARASLPGALLLGPAALAEDGGEVMVVCERDGAAETPEDCEKGEVAVPEDCEAGKVAVPEGCEAGEIAALEDCEAREVAVPDWEEVGEEEEGITLRELAEVVVERRTVEDGAGPKMGSDDAPGGSAVAKVRSGFCPGSVSTGRLIFCERQEVVNTSTYSWASV